MNRYAKSTPEQMEEHFSFYLLDSWSYSKVSCFARNEKAFEKEYIYCEKSKRSASSIAGNAYHKALECFFASFGSGLPQPMLIDLQEVAYQYIDEVPITDWKLQKTTPTIEEAKQDATKKVTAALQNFFSEMSVYMDDIAEVLDVEVRLEEWVVVNGVDIPLPCHAEIDLVVRLVDGRVAIIDHKLKSVYSDEKEVALVHGKQAITYVIQYETRHPGIRVNEVIFFENKISQNKDKSPQIKRFSLTMDVDSRKLYEAMLYEPLRRMIEAVSNPDYIYTINDSDNLTDKAELYAFWARTLIADVDDFNVPEGKKSLIAQRQRKIKDSSLASIDPRVITSFRKNAASFITFDYSMTDMTKPEIIEHVLRTFGMLVKVAHEVSGFSSDTFLLECGAGVKITNIYKFRLDIASALNVPNVRISNTLIQYGGKSYLAIEVNKKRTEDVLWHESFLKGRQIPIGLDNFRNTIVWDLDNHSTPHMLVCGATGSGKSVMLRSTIEYARAAGVDDIIIIDPKDEFWELAESGAAHVYTDIEEIEAIMAHEVEVMQGRAKQRGIKHPIRLVVVDEFADAIAQARSGKALGDDRPLEENIRILAQKGRSLGYRIICATQRASTKIITGDTKVNFPVQVCFRVPKAVDSTVVIDEEGAESLAGLGDGLMRSPEYLDMVRFQGFYYKP